MSQHAEKPGERLRLALQIIRLLDLGECVRIAGREYVLADALYVRAPRFEGGDLKDYTLMETNKSFPTDILSTLARNASEQERVEIAAKLALNKEVLEAYHPISSMIDDACESFKSAFQGKKGKRMSATDAGLTNLYGNPLDGEWLVVDTNSNELKLHAPPVAFEKGQGMTRFKIYARCKAAEQGKSITRWDDVYIALGHCDREEGFLPNTRIHNDRSRGHPDTSLPSSKRGSDANVSPFDRKSSLDDDTSPTM